MTIDAVSEMTNNALYVIIKVSLPVLLVSLIVGLIISIFQTVTSIQEQTLTFVPKIIAIFLPDADPAGQLDDEYYGRIHSTALVEFQPVCTQVTG